MARKVDIDARVAIATCANPQEAALIKTMLSNAGIHANVSGENHASLLGNFGGAFISLQVQVAVKDADEARALIAEARKGVDVSDEALAEEALAAGAPVDADALAQARAVDGHDESLQSLGAKFNYRRRVAIGMFVSCAITFGTGHAVAGAWLRAMLLAGAEIMGLRYLSAHERVIGGMLVGGAILTDLVGSQILLRREAKRHANAGLPEARAVAK
jgi:hypothetical protein